MDDLQSGSKYDRFLRSRDFVEVFRYAHERRGDRVERQYFVSDQSDVWIHQHRMQNIEGMTLRTFETRQAATEFLDSEERRLAAQGWQRDLVSAAAGSVAGF